MYVLVHVCAAHVVAYGGRVLAMTGKTDLLGLLERSLQVFLRDEGILLRVLEAWQGGMGNIFTYPYIHTICTYVHTICTVHHS